MKRSPVRKEEEKNRGREGVGGDLVYIRKMTNSLFKNAKELNVVRINSSRMSLDAL